MSEAMNQSDLELPPRVSIGMPVYNGETFIRKALDSLLAQTFTNFELIISDNGSTDGTEAICREYAARDCRIRYVRQPENRGGLFNFHFVLDEAAGEYFMWAAHDDLCGREFIENLVDCMEKHPDLVLCICDVQDTDENDSLLEINRLNSIRLSEDWGSARRLFFRYPTSNIFFCIYGLYKTEILRRCVIQTTVGWRGFGPNAEVPFLAQIAVLGRVAAIPEVLKIYRRHPDSIYYKEVKRLSKFDAFMLRLVIRLKLCKIALRGGNSLLVRLSLLNTVITSFIDSIQVRGTIIALLPAGVTRQIKIYANKLLHLWR
jgi:glycosyltransferase involved in cell wall biosynthesis